ncbi:MAG: FtsK/SpoIIIE domain-containing protein [Propionibacterium sp.]
MGTTAGAASAIIGTETVPVPLALYIPLGILWIWWSIRADHRAELDYEARLAIERVAGPVEDWKTKAWSGGWRSALRPADRSLQPAAPRVIAFRYHPGAVITDLTWPAPVTHVAEYVFDVAYQVDRHVPGRGAIQLRRAAIEPDQAPEAVPFERSQDVMKQLLGGDADIELSLDEEGHLTSMMVKHTATARASIPSFRSRTDQIFQAMMPGRWRSRWDLYGDKVIYEQRPQLPSKVLRPAPITDTEDPRFFQIPLGVDEDSRTLAWDLRSSMPHLMVIGKTGKGKTVVLRGIAYEVAARGWPIWIADPKRIEMLALRRIPGIQLVATTVEDQVVMVMKAWEEMENRYRKIEEEGARTSDFPRQFILVDEFAEFSKRVDMWWARIKTRGMPSKCPVFEKFDSLVRLARKANMHMVIGLQRPDVSFFGGGEVRDNFDARVSLGRLSPDGSQMMWGSSLGTTVPQVRGRAIASASEDDVREIQTFWMPDPGDPLAQEESDRVADFTPDDSPYPKLRVQMPNPEVDDKGIDLVWPAVLEAELVEMPADEAWLEDDDEEFDEVIDPVVPPADPDDDDLYAPVKEIGIEDVQVGDLMELDDGGGWALVDGLMPDPLDDGWLLSWTRETGEGTQDGTDQIPVDSVLNVRRASETRE